MKYWGILIAIFYGLIITILIPPLGYFCFGERNVIGDIFSSVGLWIYAIIIIVGEILLIIIPVDISERRIIKRKKLLIPIITSAILFSFLLIMVVLSVLTAFYGDKIDNTFDYFFIIIVVVIIFWIFWSILFYKNNKNNDPENIINRIMSWLIKGSILELLVAIPSHIIVRQKDECCAPIFTFAGIATGLSVMLLSFGPGIIFLYAKKIRKKRNKKNN